MVTNEKLAKEVHEKREKNRLLEVSLEAVKINSQEVCTLLGDLYKEY